jgi:hypothetical protein
VLPPLLLICCTWLALLLLNNLCKLLPMPVRQRCAE